MTMTDGTVVDSAAINAAADPTPVTPTMPVTVPMPTTGQGQVLVTSTDSTKGSAIRDLPVIILIGLIGLAVIAGMFMTIILTDKTLPTELAALPGVALGILGGVARGAKSSA